MSKQTTGREIKFRAWATKSKEMVDLKKITPLALSDGLLAAGNADGLFIPFREDIILMQFTGLKDKNEKEIYEGDIIKSKPYLFDGRHIVGQVVWSNKRAMWLVEEIDEKYSDTEYLHEALKAPHESEIIGNIYENPNFLP